MFGYRKAMLIFALILLLYNCFSSKDDKNANLIDKIPKDDKFEQVSKSKTMPLDTPHEQKIEMRYKSANSLVPRRESGQNMQEATVMMETFCTMLNGKKSTKFEFLKKIRNSDQQKIENIDNEIDQQDQQDPYYDVVNMSLECETLYLKHATLFGEDSAEEIKKYFYIICTHIAGLFGEESVQLERHDRIFKAAETYSEQFAEDMRCDKWTINKKKLKLFSDEEWEKVQDYCTNYLVKAEQFIKLKQLILTKILDHYGDIAQAQEVDVITQAWTFLIVKRPKKWYQWWKWKSECDLPHRHPVQPEEGYVTMYTPNPKAVVLAAGSFLIQIMVPLTIIFHHFLKNKNKFCPQGIFDMPYGEISSPEFYYIYVTKFAALILSYYLNAVLKADFNKGKEIFSKNWTSRALSVKGLFGGRLQNIFSYILVLLTTVVLFFQSNTLPDILLNCIAIAFIISFHRDFGETIKVEHGIAPINDGGRKLFLSYIASGARDTDEIDKNMASKKIDGLIYFLGCVVALGYVWVFDCV